MDGWPRVLLQSGGLGSVGSPLTLEGKYGGDKRNGHASLSKSGLVLAENRLAPLKLQMLLQTGW